MNVGLFVPCYINAIYPEVGVACYKLLRHFGVMVDYPVDQTCCGQPMANAGFEEKAVELAEHYQKIFEKYDYVVSPSASCTAFIRENYSELPGKEKHFCQSGLNTYDICEFLHDILKIKSLPGRFPHKVSIHNSCHGVRELHLSSASELTIPRFSKIRELLALMKDIEITEPDHVDECCGFGGMFSIEEPAVSVAMGKDKLRHHIETGAEYITGADSSCFMHMQGIVKREKLPIRFIHITEILATGL